MPTSPASRPNPGGRSPEATPGPSCATKRKSAYAEGLRPRDLADSIHTTYATCPAHPPSRRTLERWAAQRRWLTHEPP